jgi:hypothetical protein
MEKHSLSSTGTQLEKRTDSTIITKNHKRLWTSCGSLIETNDEDANSYYCVYNGMILIHIEIGKEAI